LASIDGGLLVVVDVSSFDLLCRSVLARGRRPIR
jgi:hypothetical protein